LRSLSPQLACAVSHPLAKAPTVSLADLRAATHVTMPREQNPPLYRKLYDELLDGAAVLAEHATSLEAVVGIVATGDAVALRLEDRLPKLTRDPVVLRPVAVAGLDVDFGLTWRVDAVSPLIEEFVRYATTMSRLSTFVERPE
jgi:hypothetical protein